MARTRHHGNRAKERLFGIDEWRWLGNEPKWWRTMHKHRKQRNACRDCKIEVMKGLEPTWPLDKKPHEYYW